MLEARSLRLLWLLSILGVCLAPFAAQSARSTFRADPEYLIDTWEAEDGLPENSANAIAFGNDGFLWFGTWNGLVRFDGLEFKVLDSRNTPELLGSSIINLHTDRRGRLWVSTANGMCVLESTGWRACGTNEGWAGTFVRTFADRPDGEVVFTTFDGHVLESFGTGVRSLPPPPGENDRGYFGAVDKEGRTWVVQNQFVGFLEHGQWTSVHDLPKNLTRPEVSCAASQNGGVWVQLGREVLEFRGREKVRTRTLPVSLGGVWSMTEDAHSNIWFCSFDSGLFRWSPDGTLRRWDNSTGLKARGVRTVVEDREGNLWIGTSGGGLNRFRPRRAVDVTQGTVLADRHSRALSAAKEGGLWVANSELGLFRFTSNQIHRIHLIQTPSANTSGLSVVEDRQGRVWYGEKDGLWWRRSGDTFEKVPIPWSRDVYLRSIFETSQGHVWFAGNQGALRFDGEDFRTFGADEGLPSSDTIVFAEDPQHRLWLALDKGLFRFEQGRFVEVRAADGTPIPGVLCLLPEPDGTLWLGTRSEGLWRWRDGQVDKLGPSQGYPVASVHAILDDGLGFLWMPSLRGIVRAARADLHATADGRTRRLEVILIDRQDGLPSVEGSSSQPSCLRDARGNLWFATQRGIALVHPAEVQPNPIPPPVQILMLEFHPARRSATEVRADLPGSGTTSKAVQFPAPLPERLELPPGCYGIEISYAAPSFSAPEQLRFQTRLEGLTRQWEDIGSRRVARFEQLPPGDYTFHVRAANNDGIWNEAGAAVAFTVLPYYWQTRTFRVAFGGLLAAAGAGAVSWRSRARRRLELAEMERLQREMAERKRTEEVLSRQRNELAHMSRVTVLGELSGSLAHELNQPLTSILSNAQAAQRYLAQPNPDLRELRDILADIVEEDQRAGEIIRRLRGLLKKGEEQHHELDPNLIVQEVLRLVRNDLLNQGISADVQLTPSPPAVLGDRVQLQQVLLNLILNACEAMSTLARPQRRFVVSTAVAEEGALHLSVADCGPGIPEDKLEQVFAPFYTTKASGMGLGLSVCRTIVAAHQGRLWATHRPGGGAVFHLMLPAVVNRSTKPAPAFS
ncbi:MAG: hypothetical protein JNK85_09810 [Verrucomicrobiales bacterium]|nr:hypothetical protein [Verrucomicrobiales bacterium]